MNRSFACMVFVLFAIPALASAWSISAKTGNSGGTISPPGITTISGTTGTSQTYTVTPGTGFTVSRVTLNGSVIPFPYVVNYNPLKSLQYIIAYFAPRSFTINSSVLTSGGTITGTATGITYGSSSTFTITPNTGYSIADVITDSHSIGPLTSYTFTNITSNHTIAAAFALIPKVVADAGGDQTTTGFGESNSATLDGSRSTANTGALTFKWSVSPSSPSAGVLTEPTASTTRFYADITGDYLITLVVTDPFGNSAHDTVKVTVMPTAYFASRTCTLCHSARTPQIVADYEGSAHMLVTNPVVSCSGCHSPNNRDPHPMYLDGAYNLYTTATFAGSGLNICTTCHYNGAPFGIYSSNSIGKLPHFNPAAEDMNNPSFADYTAISKRSAQYVSGNYKNSCRVCHANHNNRINADFAETGHGDINSKAWKQYDWKAASQSACQSCHTATGYIADLSSTSPTWEAADKTQEILACNGCHTSVANGTLRTAPAYMEGYSDGATFTFPAMGSSNLCIRCHSGRESGGTITISSSNFQNTPFIDSHHLAAGGIVFGVTGFEFPGRTYIKTGSHMHNTVGIDDKRGTGTNGPCVTCHMESDRSHTFSPVKKSNTGEIVAITTTLCTKCHAELSASSLEASRRSFAAALDALKSSLATRNLHFKDSYPYFFLADLTTPVTNWEAAFGSGTGKKTMGAAFNYNLLVHEPGAYAHNISYSKQLIYNSIDWIDNGALDSSVEATLADDTSGALAALSGKAVTASGCYTCHSISIIQQEPHTAAVNAGDNFTNPVFSTYTAIGKRPAQYYATKSQCSDCHNPVGSTPAHEQWAASGKGRTMSTAWTSNDFKTLGTAATGATAANSAGTDCVRCHTTTGYVQYVTSGLKSIAPFATTDDKTLEVMQCNTCHNSPVDGSFSRRSLGVVTGYYNYSSATTRKLLVPQLYANVERSNICLPCHIGRQNGGTIKAAETAKLNFSNAPFIDSHHAPGQIWGQSGYHFAGRSYPFTYRHNAWYLGDEEPDTTIGPCVGCHMGSPEMHKFSLVTKDEAGTITEITNPRCQVCHSTLTPYLLQEKVTGMEAALDALKDQLQKRNIFYRSIPPYFYQGDMQTPFTAWGNANTMGAAFNFNLIRQDIGAYAHNSAYIKRLMYDSIDFLDNGLLDMSVKTTLDALPDSATYKAKAKEYLLINGARP